MEAIFCNCFPILPNRLAYPEHIPKAKMKKHLYDSEEDLLPVLERVIGEKNISKKMEEYQNYVTQYDWSTLAPKYDAVMELVKFKIQME